MLSHFQKSSDFHYYKPTPFVPALQAAGTAIPHILRHTGVPASVRKAAFRHTTSMTVKYDGGVRERLRIG
jgi:hypothetical protein